MARGKRPTSAPSIPADLRDDLAHVAVLLIDPDGRRYLETALQLWVGIADRAIRAAWTAAPDTTILALALGGNEDAARAVTAFAGSASPETPPGIILLAYLGRFAKRRNVGVADLAREMGRVWAWLCAARELTGRLGRHPIAALLWLATGAAAEEPTVGAPAWAGAVGRMIRNVAAGEWVRRVRKTIALHRVQGILGEADVETADKEARGLLGLRLAEEIRRLRKRPPEVVARDAMAGKMNYHRVSAVQAVLRAQRPRKERHVLSRLEIITVAFVA